MLAEELGIRSKVRTRMTGFLDHQLEGDGCAFAHGSEKLRAERWLKTVIQMTVGDLVLDVIHCPGPHASHVNFLPSPSKAAVVAMSCFRIHLAVPIFPRGNHQT